MSWQTPLGRVLGTGSARAGTGHWWSQRVTAAGLVILGVWFLCSLTQIAGFGQSQAASWIGDPWNSVMLLLFCGTLAWHSTLGVQVVIEDYVHGPLLKVILLLLNRFLHIFVAIAAALAVVRISLGNTP